jgi:glycosyltransferase involved in cell wall biosynthesis
MTTKRILIATGIYPPAIGGPAEYAKNIEGVWRKEGYKVTVKYFSFEHKLPSGLRHLFFLTRSFYSIWRADFILVLDTFSVAVPISIGCRILNKKYIIRTGGDFLWESYVERTKKKVLFKNFYNTEIDNFTPKENFIFKLTKWVLKNADKIIFSTEWQKNIWQAPYSIDISKTKIVENFYGEHISNVGYRSKTFIGATRELVWKNLDTLKTVFSNQKIVASGTKLDTGTSNYNEFTQRIKESYAVILVSLGDISPNMILDAIRYEKPFIITNEIGIYDRIHDIAIFVDPLNTEEIKEKILWLLDERNYNEQIKRMQNFNFIHSWEQIANEIITNG